MVQLGQRSEESRRKTRLGVHCHRRVDRGPLLESLDHRGAGGLSLGLGLLDEKPAFPGRSCSSLWGLWAGQRPRGPVLVAEEDELCGGRGRDEEQQPGGRHRGRVGLSPWACPRRLL